MTRSYFGLNRLSHESTRAGHPSPATSRPSPRRDRRPPLLGPPLRPRAARRGRCQPRNGCSKHFWPGRRAGFVSTAMDGFGGSLSVEQGALPLLVLATETTETGTLLGLTWRGGDRRAGRRASAWRGSEALMASACASLRFIPSGRGSRLPQLAGKQADDDRVAPPSLECEMRPQTPSRAKPHRAATRREARLCGRLDELVQRRSATARAATGRLNARCLTRRSRPAAAARRGAATRPRTRSTRRSASRAAPPPARPGRRR
jgi:hypothetical protein